MIRIHAIQTGSVRVRQALLRCRTDGALRVLIDTTWSDWLPIYAWLIKHHPEGNILVDTGETSRVMQTGYFPPWHPFFRLATSFDVKPGQEIGPQLRARGISLDEIRAIVLTHLHTDHAGGLNHSSAGTRCLVAKREYESASGRFGNVLGYLPHRWPEWFSPELINFQPAAPGRFGQVYSLTSAADIFIVPTPGHTPDHVSVIVRDGDLHYFLAGDASYDEAQLLGKWPDGVSSVPKVQLQTLGRINDFIKTHRTIYLPSHDPESANRLHEKQITSASI